MANRNRLLTFIICLILSGSAILSAQSVDFKQKLSWKEDKNAFEYKVEIRGIDSEYKSLLEADSTFVEVSLPAGKYRYRVYAFDFLGRQASVSEWRNFTVLKAVEPKVVNTEKTVVPVKEEKQVKIPVDVESIEADSKVELINKETQKVVQGKLEVTANEKDELVASQAVFPPVEEGNWVVKVTNPSGLSTESDEIKIEPEVSSAKLAAELKAKEEEEKHQAEEAARKAEEERLAAEKKAEEERLAAERKAEEERLAAEKAEAERIAAEKQAEEERLAKEAEEKRLAEEAAQKAEEERLAAEKAEAERIAAEKQAEEERLAKEAEEKRLAEEERLAAEKKAEEERLAAEKAEAERIAAEQKAEEERIAKEEKAAEKERQKNLPAKEITFMFGGGVLPVAYDSTDIFEQPERLDVGVNIHRLMPSLDFKMGWLPVKTKVFRGGFEAAAVTGCSFIGNNLISAFFPTELFQLNLVFQIKLAGNDRNSLLLALKGGASIFMVEELVFYKSEDVSNPPVTGIMGPAVQGGASLVLNLNKNTQIEAGVDFNHLFVADTCAGFGNIYLAMGRRL